MAQTLLNDVLTWTYLTKTVQIVEAGVPNPYPKEYFTPKNITGNRADWIELFGTRKLVNRVPYGAPARLASKVTLDNRSAKLVNLRSRMVFDQELMEILRKFESYDEQADRALDLITEQGMNFRTRFENTRVASVGLFLATGKNYWTRNNELSATADALGLTIDQGTPANNFNQIYDPQAGANVLNAPWTLSNTNIVTQITNLQNLAVRLTGKPIRKALYGKYVAGYISQNESARAYWPYMSDKVNKMLNDGEIPNGFCGIDWIPVQNAFFEQENGTQVNVFPDSAVTFLPECTDQTYSFFQGTTQVAPMFGQYADAVAALRAAKEVPGMGRTAYWDYESHTIVDEGFDCFMPVFRNPKAYFFANVAF